MVPPQSITVIDPLPWPCSMVTAFALHELEDSGQLAPNVGGQPAAWIVPPATDREPNPSYGYVVSFIPFHERGFVAPANRFMRWLCYHYGVELHNFTPNAISQAATFVGVCEGFLGILVNWDLWVHLFRAKLHTLVTLEPRVRHAVRTGVMSVLLRKMRKEFYIPCTMTSNNAEWERGWFYLRNDEPGLPPFTGKVLKEKADSWRHGVSPSSHQEPLESALLALKDLVDAGLGAASVLATSTTGGSSPSWRGDSASSRWAMRPIPWRWRNRGCCPTPFRRSTRPQGRGGSSVSRPSGTATTTSGCSSCSPTARRWVEFLSRFALFTRDTPARSDLSLIPCSW
jgi:hypothetical protein